MFFKGDRVGDFYADLIVADLVIFELEAFERIKPVHTVQLLSHAASLRLGLLMNFHVPVARSGRRSRHRCPSGPALYATWPSAR